MQARLEGEAAQLKEAHSKTLEELAWKHHTAIEAVHSNANKDKKKLQMVCLCQICYKKRMLEFEPCTVWFCCIASFIWSYLQICCASLKKLFSRYKKNTHLVRKVVFILSFFSIQKRNSRIQLSF